MPKKVEFIESYIKVDDSDYRWCDNHGKLIRCQECKRWKTVRVGLQHGACDAWSTLNVTKADDYCSRAERKEVEDGR